MTANQSGVDHRGGTNIVNFPININKDRTTQYEPATRWGKSSSARSWSMRTLPISYTPNASMLDLSSPETLDPLTGEENDAAIVEFFTNEDGTHIEFNWEPDKEDWERQSINTISLTRTESTLSRRTMSERLGFRRRQSITGLPFHRTTTVDSTSSHWTEKSETRVDADLESVNEDFEYQSRDTMPLTRTGTAVSTASRRTLSERFCLPRALSLHRAPTMESILSWTTSYDFGTTMPLEHLIELVDKHPSLQRAEIPSTEGYWQISNGVIHRFLVLELQRQKQKPIWLRLDRRPDISAGMLKFVLDSAKAPANDTAIFSANKQDLIRGANHESRQAFKTLSTLGELRDILQIICDELVVYQLWPANCWFLVSLLQQHLQGDESGCFVDGCVKWGKTAREIRSRVKTRLRELYHIPEPLSTESMLMFLQREPKLYPTVQPLISKTLEYLSRWTADDAATNPAYQAAGFKLVDMLESLTRLLESSDDIVEALSLWRLGINIIRQLCKQTGEVRHRRAISILPINPFGASLPQSAPPLITLASHLEKYGMSLSTSGRHIDACVSLQEVRNLRREFFQANPDEHRSSFAMTLHIYGIVLDRFGRQNDACIQQEEAVNLRRELFKADPDQHRARLALYLNNYGVYLGGLGCLDDARVVGEEAVKLQRELFQANPDQHRAGLAMYLASYGVSLQRSGHNAMHIDKEAVEYQRELYQADPDQHRAMLSLYLNNYADSLSRFGERSAASASWKEAVKHQRDLFHTNPDQHRVTLAECLLSYAYSLLEAESFSDALAATQEAVQHGRQLCITQSQEYKPKLIISLRYHAHFLKAEGRHSEALVLEDEISKLESS